MFEKILIANRGEIAVRIMRTARRLGIATVAVYSDADEGALHVELADEAVRIGPPVATESYLRGEAILEAARRCGAQAVHPGYGFLSENAAFAAACAPAGVVFIGPPVEAIRIMGSKVESKRLMARAGVPLIPGYHGAAQDFETLAAEAAGIGYPVLVKASAGGGGKGMRIVQDPDALANALAGARREAAAAFRDETLLLEKYLERPRHVEIQVFADGHGECLYLFERDCSLQRRHQKVIEEAPAPALPAGLGAAMGKAAVQAARAAGYVGAGTVEFLYAAERFYFIEMNTRLQVEHPVTEMITGVDLVEWQLRVAAGEGLPLKQHELARRGHAFEARVYAEDPQRGFLPATGRLRHLRAPGESAHVRVDSGVRATDEISVHYDPMIAKLIVWDEDRAAALRRLRRALAEYEMVGVATNLEFLHSIAAHPAFAACEIDTGFIERYGSELLPPPASAPAELFALAALALLQREEHTARAIGDGRDPHSPWGSAGGWRLNAEAHQEVRFATDAGMRLVRLRMRDGALEIDTGAQRVVHASSVAFADAVLSATLDGMREQATVLFEGARVALLWRGRNWSLELDDPIGAASERAEGAGQLTAPMPGTVVAVLVEAGQAVERNAPLMVLEAMKMEHTLKAPAAGRVQAVHFAPGAFVSEGAVLLALEIQ